jgi:hypothetical protein
MQAGDISPKEVLFLARFADEWSGILFKGRMRNRMEELLKAVKAQFLV